MHVVRQVVVCLIWIDRPESSFKLANPFLESMNIRRRICGISTRRFGTSTIGASWSRIVTLTVVNHQLCVSSWFIKSCLLSVVYFCIFGKRLPLWTVWQAGPGPHDRGR
jgi:hypothetical protein